MRTSGLFLGDHEEVFYSYFGEEPQVFYEKAFGLLKEERSIVNYEKTLWSSVKVFRVICERTFGFYRKYVQISYPSVRRTSFLRITLDLF